MIHPKSHVISTLNDRVIVPGLRAEAPVNKIMVPGPDPMPHVFKLIVPCPYPPVLMP